MNYDYIKFGNNLNSNELGPYGTNGDGIQDRFGVIKKIILYGYLFNMTPVIPYVTLNGKHQLHKKNKISNLSEYYNYSRLKINGRKFNVELDINTIDKNKVLSISYMDGRRLGFDNSVMYLRRKNQRGILDDFQKLDFFLPFNKSVVDFANKIVEKYFSGPYNSIHIRRGDKLTVTNDKYRNFLSKELYDKMTRVENIKKILRKKNIKGDVFLMSDMTENDDALFEYRNKFEEFNFIHISQIPELNKIKKLDNYLLWVIERVIARSKMCKQKITMENIKDDFYRFILKRDIKVSQKI